MKTEERRNENAKKTAKTKVTNVKATDQGRDTKRPAVAGASRGTSCGPRASPAKSSRAPRTAPRAAATKAAPPPGGYATDSPPRMTQEQERCLSSIASDGYQAYLLQGVTGSGKTEVYMQLISQQLKAGRQSLLLVPEIGLTPQLVKRLKNRFGPGLAVMHSGLAAGQRLDAWQDTRSGTAKLIVGTRSAIFAPLVNAGLIILDEDHDPSYKQQDGFRYSARDLAVLRARRLNIPIVLASATPSLESLHNVDRGRYQLLTMKHRIGSAGDPQIRIIDMRHHARRHDLSTPLIAAIERHLSEDHQVLLFLNRRGFAPVLLCTQCGIVEECDRCDARLTLHPASGQLRCHHCGRTRPLSWSCPNCGTERLAAAFAMHRRWPDNDLVKLRCLTFAGYLGHYSQDACQPLHLTVDHHGRTQPDGTVVPASIHLRVDGMIQFLKLSPEELAKRQEIRALKNLMPAILEQIESGSALVDTLYNMHSGFPDLVEVPGASYTDLDPAWRNVPEVEHFITIRAREATRFTAALYLTAWRISEKMALPDWLDLDKTDVN